MKRFLALLIIFSLFALPCHAAVTGSVSLANIRLSLVDGTAFVDFSAAGTLNYLNGKLTLTDSAGKKAVGYLKAAGTGETLDSELVGWTNNAGSPYETITVNANSIDLDSVINTTGYGIAYNTVATASGRCFKVTYNLTLNSGTAPKYVTGSTINFVNEIIIVPNSAGAKTAYYTGRYDTEYSGFATGNGIATDFSTTSTSLKQLLTPSATGATITSTPGGTTYNWAYIESGFNYNDASGYSYTIVPRFVGGGKLLLGVGQ
jgi:hypothetical protein